VSGSNVVGLHSLRAVARLPRCEGCGRPSTGALDLCTWWPAGCRPYGPQPCLCWDCADEDQRLDLVDAGCTAAAMRLRGWSH
jgi:hypothetical protein